MSLLGLGYRSYGSLLLALRRRAELNLSEAAHAIGVNPLTLCDIEEDRLPPSASRFSRVRVFMIAKAYGVDEKELLTALDRYAPLSAVETALLRRDIADAAFAVRQFDQEIAVVRSAPAYLSTFPSVIALAARLCVQRDDLREWIARAESVLE